MTTSPLVSTAAAAAAVVPFHCVICFEEFNLTLRYPVVLPCGHTYVCNPCARRLKRCMECREPLFINTNNTKYASASNAATTTTSASQQGHNHSNSRCGPPLHPPPASRRYQAPSSPGTSTTHSQHQHQHQQNSEPIALPLPKNIVLMSMMEAAGSQAARKAPVQPLLEEEEEEEDEETTGTTTNSEETQQIKKNANKNSNDINNVDEDDAAEEDEDEDDDDDEEEFDLNRIISGMVTFSGPCGTYVVKENGLVVVPICPGKEKEKEKQDHSSTDVVDNDAVDEKKDADADNINNKECIPISRGQTVQVVSFSDGVAKLARGAGYIVATSSQLVKVGAPLDKCCRLEGVAETLALRGMDLQAALSENQELELQLKLQVEEERQREPVHPVIAKAPVTNDETEAAQHHLSDGASKNNSEAESQGFEHPLLMPDSPREVLFVTETSDSGLELVGEEQRLLVYGNRTRMPASPNSIDNSDFNRNESNAPGMPRYRRNSEDDLSEFTYGCFGKTFLNFEYGSEHRIGTSSFDSLDGVVQQPVAQPARRLENGGTDTYGSASSPARPLQNQTHVTNFMGSATPISSSSFDAVDFRTGMSGHRALSKTSPRSNSVLSRTTVRMMSAHNGIGSGHSASRHSNSPSSSPALVRDEHA